MTTLEKLKFSQTMTKQAMSALNPYNIIKGDNGFETASNALSFAPGVGFLGNLGTAASKFRNGHFWSGMGNTALGAASFLTGGLSTYGLDAIKGTTGIGRAAMKYVPTAVKGWNSGLVNPLKNIGAGIQKSVLGTNAARSIGAHTWGAAKPLQWAAKSEGPLMGTLSPKFMVNNGLGKVTDAMDARNEMSRTAGGMGGMSSLIQNGKNLMGSFMGGNQSSDPRFLAPTRAPFAPMFGSN